MSEPTIRALAEKLGVKLLKHRVRCTVAESCTGGLLAAAITDIAGSSEWFDCGFVTYSNQSKQRLLQVPEDILAQAGAVSEAVVHAMVDGAIANSMADIAVAISGIAGPGGGTWDKPVGTVWIACGGGMQPTQATCYRFTGDRHHVREHAVRCALGQLMARLELMGS